MKEDKDELRAMGHHADQTKSSLARGRWKLLRNALLLDSTTVTVGTAVADDCHTSIHSFPGYQMLQSIWVDGDEPHGTEECQSLMRIMSGKAGYTREDLPRLNRVLQAIRWRGLEISLKCDYRTMRDSTFSDLPLDWRAEPSEDGSSTTVCCIKKLDETTTAHDLDDNLRHPQSTDFGIKAYRCANDCDNNDVVIYIHERRRQRTTLQDLIRHRATGIDNTGSVCVWDAAQALAWYLCTHLLDDQMTMVRADQQPDELIVLELGAGMAALSGLMMLQQLCHRHQSKMKLFISDGQPECVENNKINCLLLEAELRSRVECVLLPWSFFVPTTMASIQATTTLIADCTHLEQYHGELLWTMLYHTAVGGTIYLCQPRRGHSWSTFAALLERLNHHNVAVAAGTTSVVPPMVQVQQIALAELDTKRTVFEYQSSTNGFRSDVHHPYIFSVKKLRTETENDKKIIIGALSMGMAK
jgi:Lysine methyltransferase